MKNKFDVEDFIVDVKQVINVLKCFDEFCDESILPERATKQEYEVNATWFVKRLESYRSLLTVAIKNLENNINSIEEKFKLNN